MARSYHAFAGMCCRVIGEMSEWFKERAWKVRIPQKGIGGSNPPLSAKSAKLRVPSSYGNIDGAPQGGSAGDERAF